MWISKFIWLLQQKELAEKRHTILRLVDNKHKNSMVKKGDIVSYNESGISYWATVEKIMTDGKRRYFVLKESRKILTEITAILKPETQKSKQKKNG